MKTTQHTKNDAISRRRFFKWSLFGLVSILSLSWINIINKADRLSGNKFKTITFKGLAKGVHFFDEVIIVNDEDEIKAYSSVCPHMSCFINKVIDEQIMCPCHGSAFDLEGNPLKGPASKPLKQLDYSIDGSYIIINLG